jgi:hypothetical protein
VLQAEALGPDLADCKAGVERACIDGTRLASMSDFELRERADVIGGSRKKEDLFTQLKLVKDLCEAQVATMRHFEE